MFYLLLLLMCISPLLLLCSAATAVVWTASFTPSPVQIARDKVQLVNLTLENVPEILFTPTGESELQLRSTNADRATVNEDYQVIKVSGTGYWWGQFNVTGKFLGQSEIIVKLKQPKSNYVEEAVEKLPVVVTRNKRVIDYVFTASTAVSMSILYINFGAALDLAVVKSILLRPIGPVIGFIGQFLLMPLISYGLGHLLFPDFPELALGLFFTGISPGGGASNIWTIILGGNMNLSISMTAISTFAMFGMMPLWLFTLGKTIFDKANLVVPYTRIAGFTVALFLPLTIGLMTQRYLPRIARILVRILKPCSTILILFIVVFAIVTNLYLFKLFSWQILVAGLALPWAGYFFAFCMAKGFRQPKEDCIAIAVETGIQNTGIAIFLLTYSLSQPAADLTIVVPVAVAIMTPLPLLALYCVQKIRDKCKGDREETLINTSNHSPSGSIDHKEQEEVA